ncbi:hypothetical protein RFUL19S_00306 [Rhizobacter fulvus]
MAPALTALRPIASGRSRHAADFDSLERTGGQGQHKTTTWNTRPLCCRYLAVIFETQLVTVREEKGVRDHEARWAIGLLADGQCDVLGMWWEPMSGISLWEEVFADLTLRGVERIRFVESTEPNLVGEAMHASYPATQTLWSMATLLRESLAEVTLRNRRSVVEMLSAVRAAGSGRTARAVLTSFGALPFDTRYPLTTRLWSRALQQLEPLQALPPRLRRLIFRGDEVVQQLHDSLSRAVGRHGCFSDQSEAVSFVVGVLGRAECRLACSGADDFGGEAKRVEGAIEKSRGGAVGH